MSGDKHYMARALELAAKGRGRTSPNPMVGCVVARNGLVLAEGFHACAGAAHAEAAALATVTQAEGATVYITLEPCAHHGKTPPCVGLLIEKRPERVVVAMEDPNPLVSGRGVEALRTAGIAVEVGLMSDEAEALNEAWIKYITTKTPFVIAKCAMSLDGKIATRTGDSKWVSGEASRERVHQLRNQIDAIMVGSRTIMLDNPGLTTRLPGGKGRDPVRVILDAGDYLDADRKVFTQDSPAPTWVVLPEGHGFDYADAVIHVPAKENALDMQAVMRALGEREITSLLIEGGGATLASAFEAGVVDKVMFFVAPKIVGGKEAITPV
ncbi:MAG: bifunctional diaminohydroxyphosphoribosylaminopyrimidine deaminase/5-amino-6-(5-phosphoribosylamino)uracil reductase RibD, partial [Candidatus Hydrogenedentota bacterium]